MKKYNNWYEYLNSEQDAYLDEYNIADCDVQFEDDGIFVYGQTNIFSYEICNDCRTLCIITNADDEDLAEVISELKGDIKR